MSVSVLKFSDIDEKIIPFFIQYKILGIKAIDFNDFCKVVTLLKQKKHLTIEGFNEILKIKSGMNSGRIF